MWPDKFPYKYVINMNVIANYVYMYILKYAYMHAILHKLYINMRVYGYTSVPPCDIHIASLNNSLAADPK
jgi:hypothetical protein